MSKTARWFSTGSNEAAFDAAIEAMAQELDASPQAIDYARRRAALKEWRLPCGDWCPLIKDLHYTRHGRKVQWTEEKRLIASTVI